MTDPDKSAGDTDGIPLLENPLQAEVLAQPAGSPGQPGPSNSPPPPGAGLSDPQALAELLHGPVGQQLLAELAADLRLLVADNLEQQLREQLAPQIKQAAEQAASPLVEAVLARLRQDLPKRLFELLRPVPPPRD